MIILKSILKIYHESIALYGAEIWTLRKVDQKYLECLELWWWSMENIIWTDHVTNKDVLHRVKEDRNTLHTMKRRYANWVGHILHRNCLLKHVIEEEEALDCTLWRTSFGRVYGPLVRQTIEWMNEWPWNPWSPTECGVSEVDRGT
jgi:hypothetical protein